MATTCCRSATPVVRRLSHAYSWTTRIKDGVAESDIRKLVRDAKERHAPVGVIVTRDETQLRQTDRECRWAQEEGVWILRTTRRWLRRDLDVLRPLLERMRVEGPDFLQKNVAMSEEVRRTLV